jgi:small nuclear ribonucleoprotein E
MTGRGGGGGRKTLLAPIHFIFKLLQQRSTVSIWLYEQLAVRIEGKIRVRTRSQDLNGTVSDIQQGFDEFMNLVIDDAVEVQLATKDKVESRRQLGELEYWYMRGHTPDKIPGQILLKGDNVSLIQALQ